jgi:DNA-binding NarL/FixJ family response regulator
MHILIADDHAGVRHGLREILADTLSEARFSEAGDGNEVLNLVARSEFDLLLLDINMPGRGGLDVLRDVKRDYPRLPVIIVSVQPEDQYATRCLREGAAAYINKDSAPEMLAPAVKKLLNGSRHNRPRIAEQQAIRLEEAIDEIG